MHIVNKSDFLNTLEDALNNIPYEDKKEIMYDYEEHFRIGAENGKTEDEICKSLGDPKVLAKLYKANYTFEIAREQPSSKNILRAVFSTISLGFLNLVFVFGPFIALCAVVLAFFMSGFAVTISGISLFLSTFIPWFSHHMHIGLSYISPLAKIFLGIGTTSLGILFIIADLYIAKYFYKGTIKYLKWNISIITNRKEC